LKNSLPSKYIGPLLCCWFWIFLFILPQSCTEDNEKLTRVERKRADSLVLKQTKILRKELDSICETDFEKEVQLVVDSIIIERRKEIKKILSQ